MDTKRLAKPPLTPEDVHRILRLETSVGLLQADVAKLKLTGPVPLTGPVTEEEVPE